MYILGFRKSKISIPISVNPIRISYKMGANFLEKRIKSTTFVVIVWSLGEKSNRIKVDIVITYVDGLDPVWQRDYEKYTNRPVLEKRFRDWGTLRYLFRGIAENMPFIRKVHLVVSHESQVPEWINREEVNVVLCLTFAAENKQAKTDGTSEA